MHLDCPRTRQRPPGELDMAWMPYPSAEGRSIKLNFWRLNKLDPLHTHRIPKKKQKCRILVLPQEVGAGCQLEKSLIMVCDRGKPNLVGGTVINRSLVSGPEYLAANWSIKEALHL